MRRRNSLLGGSLLVLASLQFTSANAQSGASSGTALEEIIVTAQKREQRLQEVPIAISALSSATLQNAGSSEVLKLTYSVPGLNVVRAASPVIQPYLRGVGSQGTGAGNEPSVAIYMDNFYITSPYAALFKFSNIERVEVLKGPQGTLFGRNATGGVIHILTKDPGSSPEGKISASYDNYQTLVTNFYGATPLSPTVSADLSFYRAHQAEGWGRQLILGGDANKTKEFGVRSKLVWTPSDATKVKLVVDYGEFDTDVGAARQALPGGLLAGGLPFRGTIYDAQNSFRSSSVGRLGGGGLSIAHDMDWMTVTSLTGYRDLKGRLLLDQDNGPAPLLNVNLPSRDQTFTQEFQFTSPASSKVEWIGGLFYMDNKSSHDPLSVTGAALAGATRTSTPNLRTKSFAPFAQATIPLTASASLTVGARYTWDKRSIRGEDRINGVTTLRVDRSAKSKKATWRIALDNKFSETVLGYASASRGFKSGVFSPGALSAASVDPEVLDAYEVGFKSDLANGRLRVNGAAFHYDYKNMQLQRIESGAALILNAAAAEINGLELETEAAAGPFNLRLGISVLDTKYKGFRNAPFTRPTAGGTNTITPGDASGNALIKAPDWTLNGGIDYKATVAGGEARANLNYYHNDGFAWEPDGRIKQKPYDVFNGQVSWGPESDLWRFRVFMENITNEKYYASVVEQQLGDSSAPAAPRTYGVGLEVRF